MSIRLRIVERCFRKKTLTSLVDRAPFSVSGDSLDADYQLRDSLLYNSKLPPFTALNEKVAMIFPGLLSVGFFLSNHHFLGSVAFGSGVASYFTVNYVNKRYKDLVRQLSWDSATELLTINFFGDGEPLIVELDKVKFRAMNGGKEVPQSILETPNILLFETKYRNGFVLIDKDKTEYSSRDCMVALLQNNSDEVRKFKKAGEETLN